MNEERRSRAERAFDRALAKGRYDTGAPCKESDRVGFIRGWNAANRHFAMIKRKAAEKV